MMLDTVIATASLDRLFICNKYQGKHLQDESRRILTGEIESKFIGVFGQKETGVDRAVIIIRNQV